MSADNFLDTNVLVYMLDETDVDKRQRAEALVNENLEQGNGCISFQVVQETINVLVHKLWFQTEDVRQVLEQVLIPLGRCTRRKACPMTQFPSRAAMASPSTIP